MRARANTIIYRSTRSFAQLASLPLKRRSTLDHFLLTTAERHGLKSNEIPKLLQQYELNRSRELRLVLQSEPHPTEDRKIRPSMEKSSVVLVAHIAKNSQEFRVCVSTGFAINVNNSGSPLFLTCAHTLEEMQFSEFLKTSGCTSTTLIISESNLWRAMSIPSCLPRLDLLLFQATSLSSDAEPSSNLQVDTLPITPYPLRTGGKVAIHLVSEEPPLDGTWTPWLGGSLFRKWVYGEVEGYRDNAGNDAKPGTYDSLAHMFFTPTPTFGSSGGPIVDTENGCVVGLIRGTRLDNRVKGLQGWGTSSESIYEMFVLPGLELT